LKFPVFSLVIREFNMETGSHQTALSAKQFFIFRRSLERKVLHERAGEGIEAVFAEQLDDHLGELARQHSHSANVVKAIKYLQQAGQQAAQRSAYAEASSLERKRRTRFGDRIRKSKRTTTRAFLSGSREWIKARR
jgi:predicted ATPase